MLAWLMIILRRTGCCWPWCGPDAALFYATDGGRLAASLAWRHARSPVVKFLPAVALCLAFVQDGVRLIGQVWPQDRNRNAQIWKFANELSADARIVTTMGLHQAFCPVTRWSGTGLPATAETRGQNTPGRITGPASRVYRPGRLPVVR